MLVCSRKSVCLDLEFNVTDTEVLKTLIDENEILLLGLHKAQEALEQKHAELKSLQDMLASVNHRLERMRASYPNYWEMENMHVASRNDPQRGVSNWIIEKCLVSGLYIESIRFSIDVNMQNIQFPSLANGVPVNTWMSCDRKSQIDELLILTADGTFAAKTNKVVTRKLSSTEWLILKSLPQRVAELITTKPAYFLEKIDAEPHLECLSTLSKSMNAGGLKLRHDSFNIVGMSERHQYRSVTVKFSNLCLGPSRFDELKLTLSTVDLDGNEFGQNPRLEFQEETKGVLNSWFAETQDSIERRLELRFSLPSEMDLAVWLKLSETDRLLIAGVIGSLPENLKSVQTENSHFVNNRENWIKTSFNILEIMKSILATK